MTALEIQLECLAAIKEAKQAAVGMRERVASLETTAAGLTALVVKLCDQVFGPLEEDNDEWQAFLDEHPELRGGS